MDDAQTLTPAAIGLEVRSHLPTVQDITGPVSVPDETWGTVSMRESRGARRESQRKPQRTQLHSRRGEGQLTILSSGNDDGIG